MTAIHKSGSFQSADGDDPIESVGATRTPTLSRFIARDDLKGVSAWMPTDLASGEGARMRPMSGLSARPSAHMEQALKAARHAGYQEGYQHGLTALQDFKDTHARQISAQFATLVASFEEETMALDERLAHQVTRMALELARQVVRDELKLHPELVVRVAQDAVEALLGNARHVVVHVSPQDHDVIAQGAHDVLAARAARLVVDANVHPGGVRVESDIGRVDAGIERRWTQAASTFGHNMPWIVDTVEAHAEHNAVLSKQDEPTPNAVTDDTP